MGEIAKLFITIGSKFDSKGLDAVIDKAKQVEKRTENITKGFKIAGAALTAFAVGGAAAMIKLTDKASDLEETSSKFNVVFEEQIELAQQWSKELVASYGVSTEQSKRFLASIQDLLVPMGMQSDLAAKLANKIVRLSIDLGSFNNMPTEKVMLDIQSALVGNFETMKKYGVVLNATRIEQHIMNQGLVDHKDKITQSMKAQAAYELIVNGSQAAMGDFIRTSEGFANMVKIMRARIEDLAAKLGEKLIPTMKKIVGLISDVMGWLQSLSPQVFEIAAKFLIFSTVITGILGPLALFIGFLPQIVIGLTQVGIVLKIATAGVGGWTIAITVAIVTIKALLSVIDKWIDKNNKLQGQRAEALKTLQGRIDHLKKLQKQEAIDLAFVKAGSEAEKELIANIERRQETIDMLREKIKAQQEEEIIGREDLKDNVKKTEEEKTIITQEEIEKRKQAAILAAELEKQKQQEILEAARAALVERWTAVQGFVTNVSAMFKSFHALEAVNIENTMNADIEAAEKRHEAGLTSEEDFRAEVENIRDKAAREEKKRREALKPIMIAQALANTAQGVTKALAQGGLFGIITGALVATAGLAEVAKIRMQKFGKGVRNFVGGLGIVGDEGPELMEIPRGANIYNNAETKNMMGGTINNYITVNQATNRSLAREQAELVGDAIFKKISNSRKI